MAQIDIAEIDWMIEADSVANEAMEAQQKYGDFKSTHEGYGVLAEEVSELLDAIRINDPIQIETEARQVAAVAMRIAEVVERARNGSAPNFSKRSNF